MLYEVISGVFQRAQAERLHGGAAAMQPGSAAGAQRRQNRWANWLAGTLGTLLVVGGLAGCGADLTQGLPTNPDEAGEAVVGRQINGNVHGGVYPIQGATIRLMQTMSNGYGGAAKTLLTATSDQNGDFNFPDAAWTCTTGQYAYITVTSGYTVNLGTTTNNNNVVQVGVVGPCASLQSTAQKDAANVFVSELSTVAAAYAMGNFISIDSSNASSGQQIVNISAPTNNMSTGGCTVSSSGVVSACTGAGLSHAFSLAGILVNSVNLNGTFPSGQAQFSNPNIAYSSIPAPMINTIGDILQTCVDSIGGSQCGSLFNYATPPGGTAPTNTLQVAMNMAKYPTNNVSNLYNLVAPATPFTPTLASAPSSLSVSIFYGVTASGSIVPFPIDVALDAADDAYVLFGNGSGTSNTYSALDEFSPLGKLMYQGPHNTTYLYPTQLAVDGNSNLYVTNNDPTVANDYLLMAGGSRSGAILPVAKLSGAFGVAADSNGNLVVSSVSTGTASISRYTTSSLSTAAGTNSTTFVPATASSSSGQLGATYGLAMDTNQNVWGTGLNGSSKGMAVLWANTGLPTTPIYLANGGTTAAFSTTAPFSVAPSGAGAAYFPFNDVLTSASYSTTLTAPNNGQITTTAAVPDRSEVDGAGNVFWADRESTGLLFMYTPPSSGSMSGGTVISFLPCFAYPSNGAFNCISDTSKNGNYSPAYLRGLAIDSAGNIWYAADAGYGAVIETLGVAAPAWPLLAYGHPGVKPQ